MDVNCKAYQEIQEQKQERNNLRMDVNCKTKKLATMTMKLCNNLRMDVNCKSSLGATRPCPVVTICGWM